MENRKHTRLPIHVRAELQLAGHRTHRGTTLNISFGGACVQLPGRYDIHPGEACHLTLVLQDEPERTTIDIRCEVAHAENNDLGLHFLGITVDTYQDFRQLMINHSPDPELLLEELRNNPGLVMHPPDDTDNTPPGVM